MSHYPLREVAERLTGSADLEGALSALLSYLRALQPDWHPSVALYDQRNEMFDRVWQSERNRLERRDIQVPVDHLPTRLVRKFVRPSALFNGADRRALLTKLFQSSPSYQPDRTELPQLQPLTAGVGWRSAVCLPLHDRHELLGLIVIVSTRENAFPPTVAEELQPLRCLASLAFARRMHAGGRPTPESRAADEDHLRVATALQERIQQLQQELKQHAAAAPVEDVANAALRHEAEQLKREAALHQAQVQQAARALAALEEQNNSAIALLQDAHGALADAQVRLAEAGHTLEFVRDAFEAISGAAGPVELTRSFVGWFCDHFQVDRCSLMRLDDAQSHLRILAQRGIDPAAAGRVRVAMGSGVAGWVASHRQPVLMREREDESPVRHTDLDHYESDSFMCVPLVHRNRVMGVLNLSNRRDGLPFEELDLERATLAGNVLAMALSAEESSGLTRSAA